MQKYTFSEKWQNKSHPGSPIYWKMSCACRGVNRYFWRTKQQQEIDYLEEGGGKLHAYVIIYI